MNKLIIAIITVLMIGCTAPAGEPGPPGRSGYDGAEGPEGISGKDGAEGPDNFKITSNTFCWGRISNSPFYFSYNLTNFKNNNIFVSAALTDGSVESSKSTFYSPEQNGWQFGDISISFDVVGSPSNGWWNFSLDRNTMDVIIVYHDSDQNGNPTFVINNSCKVNMFN